MEIYLGQGDGLGSLSAHPLSRDLLEDCQRDPASSSAGFHSFGLSVSSLMTGSIEVETKNPVTLRAG